MAGIRIDTTCAVAELGNAKIHDNRQDGRGRHAQDGEDAAVRTTLRLSHDDCYLPVICQLSAQLRVSVVANNKTTQVVL